MQINRLSGALGAEITGIDVSHIDAGMPGAVKAALFEHQLHEELIYHHKWRLGDLVFWDTGPPSPAMCRTETAR